MEEKSRMEDLSFQIRNRLKSEVRLTNLKRESQMDCLVIFITSGLILC